MSRKSKDLDAEDQVLWTLVTRSAKPLSDQQRNWLAVASGVSSALDDAEPVKSKVSLAIGKTPPTPKPIANKPMQFNPASQPIDDKTAKKLAKGRQKIDARVDLHGMTQDRARNALLDFLSLAKAADHRIVLVITGKGNMGTGVLKQRVPNWFSTGPFRHLVNGYRTSHAAHGGEGALYVRLRRNRARQK